MLFSQAEPSAQLLNFGRGQHEDHFCKIILNLDQWFRRFYLKIFLIYIPFSAERNRLCKFGRGHHEEHFYEIILNLNQ